MKKICFFNTYPAWGGGVKFYISHALGLKQMGYEVFAVSYPGSELSKKYQNADIPYLEMKVTGRSLLNPIKVSRLIRFYHKTKIDAVIFTTSEDLKLGSIAAKMAGVPIIAYRRGLAVPIKNRWSNRYIFKNVLTHVMANSEETKRTILKNLSDSIAADQIHVIYNALDTQPTDLQEQIAQIKEQGKGLIIGNAGRLVPQKGQQYLVEIAKALRQKGIEFTIFIAGDGPLEQQIKGLINEEGLNDQIILLGYVKDMSRFMASIDVFALTSIWEGFGYVIVEAMLAKKPVVAFGTSSTPEIVLDEVTGHLVPFPDTDHFAECIEKLRDPKLRRTLGQKGFESAQERFDIQKQILKFVDFINS